MMIGPAATPAHGAVPPAGSGMAPTAPGRTSPAPPAAYEPLAVHRAELLVDTREFRPRMLADVAAARNSVDIVMFSWQPDGIGRELAELLKAKVAAGVQVNVQIDEVGSLLLPGTRFARFRQELEAAGINLVVNPRLNLGGQGGIVNAVDHRKIVIVDRNVVYTGGINLSKKFDFWHDTMVRLEGPVAQAAHAEFALQFQRNGGVLPPTTARLPQAAVEPSSTEDAVVGTAQLLVNRPGEDLAATRHLFESIERATDRIWIFTPYLSSPGVVEALSAAARRGVDVRVAIPGPSKWKNGIFGLQLSRMFQKDLVDAGVRVYEQPKMVHAKMFLFDDEAVIGSVNLARRAMLWDHELNVAVDEPGVRARVEQVIGQGFADSREVTRDDVSSLSHRVRDFIRDVTGLGY